MSVLIKGMEMPLSCGYCPLKQFTLHIGDDCLVGAKETEYQKRPADCPLVELPPHGRLIDADALTHLMGMDEHFSPLEAIYLMGLIADAPTIIEAEVGKE